MEVFDVLKHALMITGFVFVMMLMIDFLDTASERRLSSIIKGGIWRQYVLASLLGSTPGCLGAFMNVSLYEHGIISFGAIVGGMIATSGDEAFVMLAEFPGTAMVLFLFLFAAGVGFAWISDKIIHVTRFHPCESCLESQCDDCGPHTERQNDLRGVIHPSSLTVNLKGLTVTRFLLLLASVHPEMALSPLSGVLRGFPPATYLSVRLGENPCAALLR
jgi:hypothetical protein